MNEEISRDALIIYLSDLRTMEMINHESEEKIARLDEKDNEWKAELDNFGKYPPMPEKPTPPEKKNGYILWSVILIILSIINIFFRSSKTAILCIVAGILAIILGIFKNKKAMNEYEKNDIGEYNAKLSERQKSIDEINEIKKEKENEYHEFLRNKQTLVNEINNDIRMMNAKLQTAYSANIIPLPFRDIYGVTYLHDYISTSKQSLSEALMQTNLDAMRNRLDTVIKQQAKSIIQQAKANAVFYEQNQQILEAARATMRNTAIAATYSQILATNSSLSLELQQKQLSYQKADFWLK